MDVGEQILRRLLSSIVSANICSNTGTKRASNYSVYSHVLNEVGHSHGKHVPSVYGELSDLSQTTVLRPGVFAEENKRAISATKVLTIGRKR
jgi:hypothetical protein